MQGVFWREGPNLCTGRTWKDSEKGHSSKGDGSAEQMLHGASQNHGRTGEAGQKSPRKRERRKRSSRSGVSERRRQESKLKSS